MGRPLRREGSSPLSRPKRSPLQRGVFAAVAVGALAFAEVFAAVAAEALPFAERGLRRCPGQSAAAVGERRRGGAWSKREEAAEAVGALGGRGERVRLGLDAQAEGDDLFAEAEALARLEEALEERGERVVEPLGARRPDERPLPAGDLARASERVGERLRRRAEDAAGSTLDHAAGSGLGPRHDQQPAPRASPAARPGAARWADVARDHDALAFERVPQARAGEGEAGALELRLERVPGALPDGRPALVGDAPPRRLPIAHGADRPHDEDRDHGDGDAEAEEEEEDGLEEVHGPRVAPAGPAACYVFSVDDAWVEEEERVPANVSPNATPAPPLLGLALDAEGVRWGEPGREARARWSQVFGVVLHPPEAPKRAFVLVPRRPPAPPWFAVREADLPAGWEGGLEALAGRVRERLGQRGYRDGGAQRPLLDRETLLKRVLARGEVPGALEVPVAAGPGGWWRRSLDLVAAGSAGGLAGLYAGAFTGSALLAIGVALAGATVGAAVPVFLTSKWRATRSRHRRPRVLVLAPDGCVVGLPTGPEAFGWGDLARFGVGEAPPPGKPSAPPRPCLEVVRADGSVAGRIDAAWFAEPLSLIASVAEAYRARRGS